MGCVKSKSGPSKDGASKNDSQRSQSEFPAEAADAAANPEPVPSDPDYVNLKVVFSRLQSPESASPEEDALEVVLPKMIDPSSNVQNTINSVRTAINDLYGIPIHQNIQNGAFSLIPMNPETFSMDALINDSTPLDHFSNGDILYYVDTSSQMQGMMGMGRGANGINQGSGLDSVGSIQAYDANMDAAAQMQQMLTQISQSDFVEGHSHNGAVRGMPPSIVPSRNQIMSTSGISPTTSATNPTSPQEGGGGPSGMNFNFRPVGQIGSDNTINQQSNSGPGGPESAISHQDFGIEFGAADNTSNSVEGGQGGGGGPGGPVNDDQDEDLQRALQESAQMYSNSNVMRVD